MAVYAGEEIISRFSINLVPIQLATLSSSYRLGWFCVDRFAAVSKESTVQFQVSPFWTWRNLPFAWFGRWTQIELSSRELPAPSTTIETCFVWQKYVPYYLNYRKTQFYYSLDQLIDFKLWLWFKSPLCYLFSWLLLYASSKLCDIPLFWPELGSGRFTILC